MKWPDVLRSKEDFSEFVKWIKYSKMELIFYPQLPIKRKIWKDPELNRVVLPVQSSCFLNSGF